MIRAFAHLLIFPLAVAYSLLVGIVAGPPRVVVTRRTTPPTASPPTDTGVVFVAGLADRGRTDRAIEVTSLSGFSAATAFGARQTYSGLYDWLETFFREGGARAYIGRVVGPAAAKATRNLLDAGAGIALVVNAKSPGTWGNNLTVQVAASGSDFILTIRESGTIVETSPALADTAAAVAWSATSNYVDITQGASTNDPAVLAASALSGGADDRNNITDTQWATARALFTSELGPGMAVDVGRTTSSGHAALIAAAVANGRVALLDYADTGSDATLRSAAATDRLVSGSDMAAAYGPYVTIPALSSAVSPRAVQPSALVAGLNARNDGAGISPNEPAAGALGVARYVTGVTQPAWTDAQRKDLNDAGVNVIRDSLIYGTQVYGARTLTDPTTNPQWLWISNARFYTLLAALANGIGEQYAVGRINPQRVADFQGALQGMLAPYWPADLVGDDMSQAFRVDVSENTPASMANGELNATLLVRIAGVAEVVSIQINKVSITEAVA